MSHLNPSLRAWGVLAVFTILTMVMLLPLSTSLFTMVPEPTDPLLNAWRMQWHAHALLSGPSGLANIFNTNIFYPFPLTLAYSEHFLLIAAQALPLLLLFDSHLAGMNLSVLATFVLSGYGMYLLVTGWTARPWAGLVAGVIFAFSPLRFGQLNHLELLVTQWLPLALLALHWTLTRPGWRYPLLFAIFFNLQLLSGFHYGLNLAIACTVLLLIYAVAGRVRWRKGLWAAGAATIVVTLLLNWPIWQMYLRFSEVMGAVRTPGEVRIYSAALTDYLTTLPYNWLYGWTFGRWQSEGHQFQPLMPLGLTGLLLALLAVVGAKYAPPNSRPAQPRQNFTWPVVSFLLLVTGLALLLSFGLNENALGERLAPLLVMSPYRWLYDHVFFFQGIRVPARFGLLVAFGLAALAGWGAAALLGLSLRGTERSGVTKQSPRTRLTVTWIGLLPGLSLIALALVESWSAPLVGPEFPAGEANLPPVYRWLAEETPPEAVVLELPHQNASEFLYEYYASHHWRRLANGGTGFTPPIYKDLRRWFNAFPDPRSVDIAQQLGIDTVLLHQADYTAQDWQRLLDDLPRYLPTITQIRQFDGTLALRLAPPDCRPDPDHLAVSLGPAALDGLPHALAVTYQNNSPAAFVADVTRASRLIFGDTDARPFTEPLVTPAGEAQTVVVPLAGEPQQAALSGAWLATLDRTVSPDRDTAAAEPASLDEQGWQPLGLQFAAGPRLLAYQLHPSEPQPCATLHLALRWEGGQPGDTALVQLLDPFGRPVIEHEAQPWTAADEQTDRRVLPLVDTLPPGQYGFRVLVRAPDGSLRQPVTEAGVTIPPEMIPPLPLVIHAQPAPAATAEPLATFAGGIELLGAELTETERARENWLQFSLLWQTTQPVEAELTVFTQLLGPDGQVWGQRDNPPGGGWYGLSLWLPGQPVADHYAFSLPPDAPPGRYRLIAGLYHSDTQQRLTTASGADFVELGEVILP